VTDWRSSAACLTHDPELFFPVGESDTSRPQIREAKAVCARCPVAAECLEYVLDTRQDFGVWGGTSVDDRRRLRRRAVRARAKEEAS